MKRPEDILQHTDVLLVEDDVEVLNTIGEMLKHFCRQVFLAKNGEEALAVYDLHRPLLIITDIVMPKMDGIAFTKALRQRHTKIPIIALSSYEKSDYFVELISQHITHFIVKPVTFKALYQALVDSALVIDSHNLLDIRINDQARYSFAAKTLYLNNQPSILTLKEMELLELLLSHPNQLVTKEKIEKTVWSGDLMTADALKTLVKKIRQKVGKDAIKTLHDMGYMLITHI